MRIFKHKCFDHWAQKEEITDLTLKKSVTEMANGLYEANLGSGLYKKRVARDGHGKRSSYRTLLAFKQGTRCIYVFGFAKNERANISQYEKEIYKRLAKEYLNTSEDRINRLILANELIEVK